MFTSKKLGSFEETLAAALFEAIKECGATDKKEAPKKPSIEAQLKDLGAFIRSRAAFAVGDRVIRNAFGEQRYRFPVEDQAAVISTVFSAPKLDDNGSLVHGEIAYLDAAGHINTAVVDFRNYRKLEG